MFKFVFLMPSWSLIELFMLGGERACSVRYCSCLFVFFKLLCLLYFLVSSDLL